jgi:ribosomal protein S18 acetylase RimI-like enzyme
MPHHYSIRPALLADMPAVGLMQHACWMAAYPGVLDQAFLNQLSPEGIARYHSQHYDAATGALLSSETGFFVATPGAKQDVVLGMVRGGPTRARTAAGDAVPRDIWARFPYELFAIHVDPMNQRTGIGRSLFGRFARSARALGHNSLVLWVLTNNRIGRGFYDRLGGKPVGGCPLTLGGRTYPQLAYAWEDLSAVGVVHSR